MFCHTLYLIAYAAVRLISRTIRGLRDTAVTWPKLRSVGPPTYGLTRSHQDDFENERSLAPAD